MVLKLMDQICSLMETTMRHKAGDRGLPMGLPRSWRIQRLKVCMSSAVDRNVLDDDFLCDIETSKRSPLDEEVSRIVASSWVDRKHCPGHPCVDGESQEAHARLQETAFDRC